MGKAKKQRLEKPIAPLPWRASGVQIFDANGDFILRVSSDELTNMQDIELAERVTRQINVHPSLVEALQRVQFVLKSVRFPGSVSLGVDINKTLQLAEGKAGADEAFLEETT